MAKTPKRAQSSLRATVRLVVLVPLWCCAVFVSAGRIDWVRGWVWLIGFGGGVAVMGLLVRCANPGLLTARANLRRKDTKLFDKVCLAFYIPLELLQPIVGGLDAVRFRWSSMPFATVYPGLVLLALGMTLATWALRVNPYAETTVRIQTDRGQKVVTSGPYLTVRHPMYVGGILMYPGVALILGSMWALALSGLIVIVMVWRTALEDRTLRRELPGYEEFASVTRYRLIPRLW
jgi:protein-S-isoprenylcysteine O-methyltransferase Ste14